MFSIQPFPGKRQAAQGPSFHAVFKKQVFLLAIKTINCSLKTDLGGTGKLTCKGVTLEMLFYWQLPGTKENQTDS